MQSDSGPIAQYSTFISRYSLPYICLHASITGANVQNYYDLMCLSNGIPVQRRVSFMPGLKIKKYTREILYSSIAQRIMFGDSQTKLEIHVLL